MLYCIFDLFFILYIVLKQIVAMSNCLLAERFLAINLPT